MAFIERVIQLTFTKAVGTFSEGKNTVTYAGLRVLCDIIAVGGIQFGQAQLKVYGLTLSIMQELSALNQGFLVQKQIELQISASDEAGKLNLIFDGQVMLSQIDLNSQPDSALIIIAQAGVLQAQQIANPTSYLADTDHFVVMKYLAGQMGLQCELNGTPLPLSKPYFPGSFRDQVIRCADAVGVNWTIDLGYLIVWPRFGTRSGLAGAPYSGKVPLVSPETGMVGYPSYSASGGIAVKTIFNPILRIGTKVTVASQLSFANGTWATYNMKHALDSQTPGGRWFTTFDGYPFNASIVS